MSLTVVAHGERSSLASGVDLAPDVAAPRRARRMLRGFLAGRARSDLVGDAEIVLGELVANAVRHAGESGRIRVEVELTGSGRLYLAVTDRSSKLPVLRQADHSDESGRGLRIVDALCERWGVEELRTGKRVWARL